MRRSSEGSLGQDLVQTAANWSNWVRSLVTTHFCLVSGLFWTPRDPKSTRFGHKCPFLNHMGPNIGPNSKLGQCFFSLAECPSLASWPHDRFATFWILAPYWPFWGQKGSFCAKTGLLWAPRGPKGGPITSPKFVVTMIPTQSDQLAAVGIKSGPQGPFESLWGPIKGPFGPK